MPITPPTLYQGVKYIRIHKKDLNNLQLGDSIVFANEVTVAHSNATLVYTIVSIKQDTSSSQVLYLEVIANKKTSPTNTSAAITIFTPQTTEDFTYSEYNALIGNAMEGGVSTKHYQVDRGIVQDLPTNIDAIINQSAPFAEVSNQLTSATGYANARYNGSRLGELVGQDRTLDVTVPYFAAFDSIRQTSDITGVYQFNIPQVINADGDMQSTTDTKTLFYDMPSIFTQEQTANTSVRFDGLSSVNEQRTQKRYTDTFEIYKGGQDITTLAVSTSGSLNLKRDTVTVKSGSFFDTIEFGEDVGIGYYKVEATFSGSDGGRTQVTKNTEQTVEYIEHKDVEGRYNDANNYYEVLGEAECDLHFNSTVLLSYDRQGTGWKSDIKTFVRFEVSGDNGNTWNTIKEIVIPRFWNRYDVRESDIPADVAYIGHRVIDGITGMYIAVNLISGFIPFGGQRLRTVVRYETSGNDRCYINNKFEFLDSKGNPLKTVAGGIVGLAAGTAGGVGASALGATFALSNTSFLLALLTGPVGIGAAVGALTLGGILSLRNLFGRIRYQDVGINKDYVNVKYKEGLETLYTEFKADQEIQPLASVSLAAAPFSRSLGGPLSASLTPNPIHYGSQGNPWIILSPSLDKAQGGVQSLTDHEPLGFKDFVEPFRLQRGDQIKFEGNENKVHTVIEYVPANSNLPPTYRGSIYSMYKVYPPIPGKTWVKNFQIRRFIQDPTSVLLVGNEDKSATNKLYFTSSSLKGTITPQFMSPTLEENISEYKQQLIAKGIIS